MAIIMSDYGGLLRWLLLYTSLCSNVVLDNTSFEKITRFWLAREHVQSKCNTSAKSVTFGAKSVDTSANYTS